MAPRKRWYRTKDFLKLRWQWYAKLKESGFVDIEYHDQNTGEALPVMKGFTHMDAVRFYRPDRARFYSLVEAYLPRIEEEYGPGSWQAAYWRSMAKGYGAMKTERENRESIRELGWPKPESGKAKKFFDTEISKMLAEDASQEPEIDPETVGYDMSGRLDMSICTPGGPARHTVGGQLSYVWDDPDAIGDDRWKCRM